MKPLLRYLSLFLLCISVLASSTICGPTVRAAQPAEQRLRVGMAQTPGLNGIGVTMVSVGLFTMYCGLNDVPLLAGLRYGLRGQDPKLGKRPTTVQTATQLGASQILTPGSPGVPKSSTPAPVVGGPFRGGPDNPSPFVPQPATPRRVAE